MLVSSKPSALSTTHICHPFIHKHLKQLIHMHLNTLIHMPPPTLHAGVLEAQHVVHSGTEVVPAVNRLERLGDEWRVMTTQPIQLRPTYTRPYTARLSAVHRRQSVQTRPTCSTAVARINRRRPLHTVVGLRQSWW